MSRDVRRREKKVYALTMTALISAVTCVLAPLAIPIGPVPVTLVNLVICLSLYLLGGRLAFFSCLVYILLGLAGMPVFAGFTGGAGKLLGPTGGYILGYLVLAAASGVFVDRFDSRVLHGAGMVLGTALCYVLGTVWYCISAQTTAAAALTLCVLPFIPGDAVKIGVALTLGPVLRTRLEKAGLLQKNRM